MNNLRPKTIFVVLFSNVVVENFAIPGGVLDTLIATRAPGTRLVFLTGEPLLPHLDRFRQTDVVIEVIEKVVPRGLIQKLFYFFYSYLIFTDTTRILATFGARVDVPPGARNRHVALIKQAIARTAGRLSWVKLSLVPWLYNRIFRTRPYRALFNAYEPDAVFLPNIGFFPDIECAAEARRQGIISIGMPSNWDHLNKYYIPVHTDVLLVQNEPMREEAIELHEYQPEHIRIVGFPQFDMYQHPEYLMSRDDFCRTYGIPPENKLILFISGAAYSQDEPDILHAIFSWEQSGQLDFPVTLMIRPYVVARDLKREQQKYHTLNNEPGIVFNWRRGADSFENKRYFMSMLYHADVIISIFSTTAIEAALFDKPTITIGFDGHKKRPYHESIVRLEDMSHFKHVLSTGGVEVARSFEHLRRLLTMYLKEPTLGQKARRSLVERMCYRVDAEASKRVAEAVLSSV